MAHAKGQEHPISVYLWIWGLLFVLSTFSYLVDYFNFEGQLRWSLILLFMILKAGLIVAVFMHMAWERLALTYAIILPPVLVLVFVAGGAARLVVRPTALLVPLVGFEMPATSFSSVLLPEPLRPMTPSVWPRACAPPAASSSAPRSCSTALRRRC